MKYLLSVIALFIVLTASGASADVVVSADALLGEKPVVVKLERWKHKFGDNPAWADPSFDDSDWTERESEYDYDADDRSAVEWFRIHLQVDPALWKKPLALEFTVLGAMEIFLDGEMIHQIGVMPESINDVMHIHEFPIAKPITFDARRDHVIAIRLADSRKQLSYRFPAHPVGFKMSLAESDHVFARATERVMRETKSRTFFGAIPLAVGFLHLLLFIFYPKQSANLYYAFFTICAALIVYLPLQHKLTTTLGELVAMFKMFTVVMILISMTGLRFLYALFYPKLPRLFWLWVAAGIITGVVFWNGPMTSVMYFMLASFVEILRILIVAIVKKKPYARLIAIGVAAFILASAYQIIAGINASGKPEGPELYLYGLMIMVIIMSIGLARRFARVNVELEGKLVEVKALSEQALEHQRQAKEAEERRLLLESVNALKAVELEEARKRQKVLDELEAANIELRRTQSQLVQSEKMAALGNLVAGVAHEINTPIGAMNSMHNTLVRALAKLKDSVEEISPTAMEENQKLTGTFKIIEDANSVIQSGSCRVTDIIKRLRSFARLDEAELKKVDIHEGLEDTLMLVHHQLKHHVTVTKNYGKIPEVACYPGQLNQVFLNLLVNAGQAIEEQGEITISTYQTDDRICIEIKDTGKGIPENKLTKIFDPGFTTKGVGVGTGLGLSICYQIVQAHKGEIRVESEVGQGTIFTIVLPTNLDGNAPS